MSFGSVIAQLLRTLQHMRHVRGALPDRGDGREWAGGLEGLSDAMARDEATIVMAVLCVVAYGKDLVGVAGSLAMASQVIFFLIVTTLTYWCGVGLPHAQKIVLSAGMAMEQKEKRQRRPVSRGIDEPRKVLC